MRQALALRHLHRVVLVVSVAVDLFVRQVDKLTADVLAAFLLVSSTGCWSFQGPLPSDVGYTKARGKFV